MGSEHFSKVRWRGKPHALTSTRIVPHTAAGIHQYSLGAGFYHETVEPGFYAVELIAWLGL